jgi:hypothetical protein
MAGGPIAQLQVAVYRKRLIIDIDRVGSITRPFSVDIAGGKRSAGGKGKRYGLGAAKMDVLCIGAAADSRLPGK